MVNLGQKVREARQSQNLTLREVARRTGLTASLISQVERGLANPSVSSLYRIAEVLGLSMDYFFETGKKSAVVAQQEPLPPASVAPTIPVLNPVLKAIEREIVGIAGGVQWQRLTPKLDDVIEFIELHYEAGASSGELAYQHRGREYGVIVQGQLTVELGFNKYIMEPGDSISFDSTVPHRLSNAGETLVKGIWVVIDRY